LTSTPIDFKSSVSVSINKLKESWKNRCKFFEKTKKKIDKLARFHIIKIPICFLLQAGLKGHFLMAALIFEN